MRPQFWALANHNRVQIPDSQLLLIQKFPRVLIAGLFGFKDKPYFEADKGSEKAPTVKF